jgi:hypothetical protein
MNELAHTRSWQCMHAAALLACLSCFERANFLWRSGVAMKRLRALSRPAYQSRHRAASELYHACPLGVTFQPCTCLLVLAV